MHTQGSINKSFCWLQIFKTRKHACYEKWVVTDLPPLKESRPEIPRLRAEEVRELFPEIVLPFPGSFLLRVVTPLNLEKLDFPSAGYPYCLLQNSERFLTVGQVLVQVDRAVVNTLEHLGLVRHLEASSELGYMKNVVEL